jgi:hypothetical protein
MTKSLRACCIAADSASRSGRKLTSVANMKNAGEACLERIVTVARYALIYGKQKKLEAIVIAVIKRLHDVGKHGRV